MKQAIRILAALALSLYLLPLAVYSQENDAGASSEQGRETSAEKRRAAWESLSEEEKQAKREEQRAKRELRRAQWEAMTPDQREAMKKRRKQHWRADIQ